MKDFDAVDLRNGLPESGLEAGDVGAIVHRHSDSLVEVEFETGEGTTVAVVTLTESDLRPIRAREILHVRSLAS